MVTAQVLTPEVLWAQRKDLLYLTIPLADIKDEKVDLTESRFEFEGVGGTEGKPYHLSIDFYKPIDVDASRRLKTGQQYTFVLKKQEEGPYWPRIQKESGKLRWLKTDFGKWRDEDEDDEEEVPGMMDPSAMSPFGNMMDMANFNMSDMAGLGGAGGMMAGGEEVDSDDEEVEELDNVKNSSPAETIKE